MAPHKDVIYPNKDKNVAVLFTSILKVFVSARVWHNMSMHQQTEITCESLTYQEFLF